MLKFLHWFMAIFIFALLVSGYLMTEFSDSNSVKWILYNFHESIGLLVFIILLIRIVVRIKYSYFTMIKMTRTLLIYLRNSVHFSLYGFMLIMAFSGYLQRSPYGVNLLGISIPVIRNQFEIAGAGFYTHIIVAKLGLVILAIHLLGYCYHLMQQKFFLSRINHDQQI